MKRLFLFILLSLIVHLLIFEGIYLYKSKSGSITDRIEFSINENKNKPVSSKGGAGFHYNQTQHKLRVKDLLPKLNLSPSDNAISINSGTELPLSSFNLDKVRLGFNSKGFSKELENISLYEHIYNKINGGLFYPSILGRANIQGTVNARLYFAKDGHWDSDKSQIKTSSSYLEILVKRILRETLSEPLSQRYLRGKDILVDTTFMFQISEHDDNLYAESKNYIVNNVLVFYKHHPHSALQWKLGPLQGIFILPVVSLDVLELVDYLDNIFISKHKDPLTEYKVN